MDFELKERQMDSRLDNGGDDKSNLFPSRIFKYVPPERIDVLENLTIRFTQPSALNDPFELKPMFKQMVSDEELDKVFDPSTASFKQEWLAAINRQYNEQPRSFKRRITLKQYHQMMRSAKNSQAIIDYLNPIKPFASNLNRDHAYNMREKLHQYLSQVGILSFSSSSTITALWAHYALEGKGLVYEFDASNAFFNRQRHPNDDLFHLRRVLYKDSMTADRALSELHADDVYYTKAQSWAYEAEWRIAAPLDHAKRRISVNGDEVYLFELPATAITRVILGEKADSNLITKVKSLITSKHHLSHIEIAQIRLNLESHSLDVLPLN
jgi:hypothetical protein